MDTAEKTREDRVRRMLARQGYTLSKSRRRDPRAYDFGHYTVSRNGVIVYGAAIGRTLDDVEQWALSEETARTVAESWEEIGEVAVDTARLMLADPCLISTGIIPGEFLDEPAEDWYTACARPDGRGLAMTVVTGYGDGFYPVSVTKTAEGRIAAIRVDFIAS